MLRGPLKEIKQRPDSSNYLKFGGEFLLEKLLLEF